MKPGTHFDSIHPNRVAPPQNPADPEVAVSVPDTAPSETPEQLAEQAFERRTNEIYTKIESLGGPGKRDIQILKEQVPGGRVRIFSLDNKRFYLVRGISGMELDGLRKEVPANSSNPDQEMDLKVGALCTVWTNAVPSKKLTEFDLRSGTAGLPSTLMQLIMTLSDFATPEDFQTCSIEL